MVLLSSPICDFGRKMPEFKLKGLDDNFFDSQKIENYDAILIFFICPLFLDLVSTTIVKMCFKQNIFAGHKDNIYQKIVSHTKNHLISTSFFSIIQIIQIFLVFDLFQE